MRTVVVIQLIGIVLNLPRSDLCKFGTYCDYPCHCQNNVVCDPLDGSCPAGCDDGDLEEPGDYWYTGAWGGYGCQIGNVAYGKNATQGPSTYETYIAGFAVNGNHNPTFHNDTPCTHTTGSSDGWWQVDLGVNFVIYGVGITNRWDCCSDRLQYTDITVSDTEGGDGVRELCHRIGYEGNARHLSVNCSQPLRGRYVRLQRWAGRDTRIITLCEVQVRGYLFHDCPDTYYGVGCGTPCNCQLPCNDISGECPQQNCTEGWMSYNCQTGCNTGTWGTNCQQNCNCLDDQEECDRFKGRCMSGCHGGFGGIGCNLVLPILNSSTVGFSDPTSNSIEVRFNAWVPGNQEEHIPSGYIVQRRDNVNATWMNGTEIDHDIDTVQVIVVLRGLEPESEYYVRVVPFIVDGGEMSLGHPTAEVGPFRTLRNDKGVSQFPIAMATGIPVGLIVVVVAVVVVALFARRHVLRGKDSEQHPAVVLDSTQPGLYEDVGPGGQENCVYEEIVEYPETNGGKIYYNIPSTAVDNNIQPVEGIKDIKVNEDVILHDLPPASFTSGDQESGYQQLLSRPSQEDKVQGFAEELHNRNVVFSEGLLDQYADMGSKAFLDTLPADETSVSCSDIATRYPGLQQPNSEPGLSTIQGQYVLLQCAKPLRKANTEEVALIRENLPKNRDSTSVPSNIHRAHLTTLIDGRNDYINAVIVDGYRNRGAYIATQLPKPNTVIDFWRLIYDHKCSYIIALQQPDPEDESTPIYWPTTTETQIDFGILRVTLVEEDNQGERAISMKEFEITVSQKESHNVRLYQFLAWPADSETTLSMDKSLMLLNHARRCQLRSGLGPLCFICKFGYERCGLMIAACYMLEKINVDREVDVFQAVKQVRNSRPEFVTLAQYEFLYELAIAYINCEEYTNFK